MRYCNTKTSHNSVNNMWILKNSTSLLSSLDQLDVCTVKLFIHLIFQHFTHHFHIIYRNQELVILYPALFERKMGQCKIYPYQSHKIKRVSTHDVTGGGHNLYTAYNISKMIEFLIDNIFVQFGGCLFLQVIGILEN